MANSISAFSAPGNPSLFQTGGQPGANGDDITPRDILASPTVGSAIKSYLARLDAGRRQYAGEYLQWLAENGYGAPPPHTGMNPQSAYALRKRIDQMLLGADTYPAFSSAALRHL